ncbi:MAG: hypothetical protein IPP45_10665 [Sphingomonadales bacterium]|nr:hypothetical protein [Sphingomonadales bacterium]
MQQVIWPRVRSVIGLTRLAVGMLAACTLAAMSPAHAAKWFVDSALGDVKAEEKVQPATPKPVQIFEFQRDGSPNSARPSR